MPAHKKDPSVRARRNVTSTRSVLKRPTGRAKVPVLPTGTRWHPQVRADWAKDWASPMALKWEDADKSAMFMIARLSQQFWDPGASPTVCRALAGEIRQLRAQLGLTPGGRKSLEWEIESADKPSTTAAKNAPVKRAAAVKKPAAATDPRARHLAAVK